MTQVSKYPISKDVYKRIFEVLSKAVANNKKEEDSLSFLREFLTPTEQIMLAKRLAIIFLLEKDYNYREISRILRVSTGTVGKTALMYSDGVFLPRVVKRIMSDEEMEKFWLGVGEKVTALFAAGGSKSKSWVYLRDEIRKKNKGKAF